MKEEPTNGELKVALDGITKAIENGFNGIHTRQDKTNGNVMKNTKFRWYVMAIASFCILLGVGNVIKMIMI